MCGIVGIVGAGDPTLAARFVPALTSLAHRGPDGCSQWQDGGVLLGHRRLAIIDLSDGGRQPMVDPASGLVLSFNGEIYNYLELRAELQAKGHQFATTSDSEVLLKGIAQSGIEFLNRCNGMWALAVWDPGKRRLTLARDRFGVKPLYFSIVKDGLMFASEPKALHVLDPSLAEPNTSAVVDLVVRSALHAGTRTLFKAISAVPAAHYVVHDAGSRTVSFHRYWDYPAPEGDRDTPSAQCEQFVALFESAVKLRLRSDVPVGLTLSGGLDSSSILAAVKQVSGGTLNCYTSIYSEQELNEQGWAEKAARYAGAPLRSVTSDRRDWRQSLDRITYHMDGPGYSPAVLPLWSIMQRARSDKIPVLLEGQGADEYLAGYPQYAATSALVQLKSGQLGDFAASLRQMAGTFGAGWTSAWLLRQSFPASVARATRDRRIHLFRPEIARDWRQVPADTTLSSMGRTYDPLRAALWQDHALYVLPALLHYGDSVCMAHGIENRLPFMDYRLVEWVFRARPELLDGGRTKSPVRDYLHRRGYQAIADRRDKKGYPTPIGHWRLESGKSYLAELVADARAPVWDIMRRERLGGLVHQVDSGSARGLFHAYKIITTDIWLRQLAERRKQHASVGARVQQVQFSGA